MRQFDGSTDQARHTNPILPRPEIIQPAQESAPPPAASLPATAQSRIQIQKSKIAFALRNGPVILLAPEPAVGRSGD